MPVDKDRYSDSYKTEMFYLWYNNGKPSAGKFMLLMPAGDQGTIPSKFTLNNWINQWKHDCKDMDERIKNQWEDKVVASKMEMFDRHAALGREMQTIALTWIKENKEKLTPGTAVRMLVDGVEIEQATAGVSDAIKKMLAMSDEDLQNEIVEMLTSGHVEILDDNANND